MSQKGAHIGYRKGTVIADNYSVCVCTSVCVFGGVGLCGCVGDLVAVCYVGL